MEIDAIKTQLDQIWSSIKNNLIFFFGKKYANDDNYSINFARWTLEVTTKNKIIYENKVNKTDKEMARRRRGQVYWIDFGKNIGSEFNDQHFCIVIRESEFTAIVVPISSQKEDTPDWKRSEELIVLIGLLNDLPGDKLPCYALVHQIRTVSKQRLSNFKYKGSYIEIKLTNEQLDKIDQAVLKLSGTTKPKENNSKL